MEYTKTQLLLDLENISLAFGDNLILRDINLQVHDIVRPDVTQGQIVGLLAPSGIGKTQLLKIIAGLQKPTTGTVKIGVGQTNVSPGEVGVVQQNYPLLASRTIQENLQIASRFLPKTESKEKVDFFLNHFGMWERRNYYPAQLSGGQKQRVAIAQQMLCSKYFLLLDEPFSGLDVNMIDKVSEMIVNISNLDELNTVVIVSHDISSTAAISDTLWMMGKDKHEDGTWIPGARIKKQYDLIKEELAWRPDIRNSTRFLDFTKQIRSEFKTLG